jgi:hypothetical protein
LNIGDIPADHRSGWGPPRGTIFADNVFRYTAGMARHPPWLTDGIDAWERDDR